VISNDSDPEDDNLTSALGATNVTNGTLTFNNDGSFTYTPNADFNGTDQFTYTVSDGTFQSNEAIVTITVVPVNDAPVITSVNAITVDENQTTILTVTATDTEGNDITYSVDTGTGDGNLFSIDPSTGNLTFSSAPDYENPTDQDANNTYLVTVIATDNGTPNQSTSQLITVTVNDINEAAPVFSSATTVSVQENQTAALTVAASDPEGNTVTYSLPGATNDNDLFTINTTTGVLTFTTAPDFESPSDGNGDNTYIVTVIASDNQSQPLTATQTITITVTDVNEGAPGFTSPANVSVDENQTSALTVSATDPEGNTVTYSLQAGTDDNDLFTIDSSTGVLTFNTAPDFEAPVDDNADNNYVVSVIASDNQSTPLTTTQVITITINDVNEPPVAVADTYTTDEDTPLTTTTSNSVLRNDSDPEGTTLTAILYSSVTNGELTFNSDGTFTYTPDNDFNGSDSFTYRASDGPLSSTTVTVTITITPVNDPPGFTSAGTVSFDENGTGTVIDVNVTDPENNNITFSLPSGTNDNNLFNINSTTGEITFVSPPDYESPSDQDGNNDYIVTVTATDDGTPAQSASQTITVTVNNVNEPPVFTSPGTGSVAENQITAFTVTTSDPENNNITYSLPSTGDNSLFSIDAATGVLSFRVAPDYESPSDANRDNVYVVTVDATDDGYPAITTSQIINITVTDVNEVPSAVNDSYTTSEDTQLSVSAADGVLSNDTDEEGTALTATLQTDVTHGNLTFNPDGSFTYDPDPNYNGSDSFTYTASDGTNTSDPVTVNIMIGAVNDPPVAYNETYSTNEDITLVVEEANSVLLNDTDPDGNALTAKLQTSTTHGTLTFNGDNGTFTYVPNADFNGSDSFTYVATDGFVYSNEATVTINITPVNDSPVANDDTGTVDEGSSVSINIVSNDSDIDGTLDLTSVVITNITNGTVTYDGNGTVTFTHDGSETTTAGFSYTINDNQGAVSNQASVTITVNPVNDLPVAVDDNATVNEGESVDINIISNDSDEDGTLDLSSIVITNVTNGTYVDNGNGTITFTHNGSETTSAGFSYTIRDNDGGISNQALVSITVNPVNDAPVFTSPDAVTTDENQTNVLAVETSDAEGDNVTYSLPASDDNSLFAINSSTGILTFISAPDYENPLDQNHDNIYVVTVMATDNGSPLQQTSTQTISITVTNVNEAPVVNDDSYTIFEDNQLVTTTADGILANDNDPDNDVLTITIQNNVSHGTLIMNNDGTFTYTPDLNYNGSDFFTYTVNDGSVNSSIAVVSISITAVNDAPQANDDTYSVDEDTPLSVNVADGVLINDTDPDNTDLTVSLQNNVSNGVLTMASDGSFQYTPNHNFNGTDQFTYTISDGIASSGVATVVITVNSINDTPVAQDDSYTTNEDTPLNIDVAHGVLNNDSDPDMDALRAIVQNDVQHGTLVLNDNGSFTYTPAKDYNGSDSFTYFANDGTISSQAATVTITITSQNDNPVANDDAGTVNEGGSTTINIVANDVDVDGTLDYSSIVISNVTNGTCVDNGNGTVTFTHDGSETTTAGFSYTINDDQNAVSNTANVTITVVQSNDIPVANNDSGTVNEGQSVTINITANDNDPDGTLDPTSIIFSNLLNGTCVNNNDGTVTFTHDGSETTTAGFSYTINDDLGATSNVAHVSITVNPQNDPPQANDDLGTVNEGGSTTIDIVANDTDADGTLNLNSIFIGNVINGITVDNGDGTITFTHNGSETTKAGFSYTISDDQGAISNQAYVLITVNPVNDAPIFTSPDAASVNENQTDILTVTTVDAENDAITYSLDASGDNALFAINSVTGELSFVSAPDYEDPKDADRNNEYIVNVTATDNGSPAQSTLQQIIVTVLNINEGPVAEDDTYNTNEDDTLQVAAPGVMTNDSDQENDPMTASLQDNVTHGNLSFNPDGSFRYIPEANYNGTDQFSYYISDGNTMSTVAIVTLNIHPQNDAPVGNDDTYNTSEDRTLIVNSPGILANDIDIDGNSLTATLISTTSNGVLTLNPDGSFTYQPNTNYSGTDSFTYAANDGNLLSNTVTVTINVGETNDAPVSENDSYVTIEDMQLTVDMPGVLDNDSDPDNNSLSAVLVSNVTHGVLSLNTNGSFTYTPNANYNGFDSFTYQASDGQTTGNTATVTITIQPANDAPVALNDNMYTAENTPDNINVTINDSDPYDEPEGGIDENSVAIVIQPKHGTAFPIGNKINYTPHNGFYGNDTLSYRVFDTGYPLPALSDTALVFIKVARRSPLAINDTVSISEDNIVNINVLANDQDIDIDPTSVSVGTPPNHGTVSVDPNTGVVTYTPALNYFGPDGFTYTVKDLTNLTSNIANVVIEVIAVPDPPVTTDGNYSTPEDVSLTIRVDEVASDPDGDLNYGSVEFVNAPSNGTITNNSVAHEMTYTPNTGFSGIDTLTFRIYDQIGTVSNTSLITITVSNEAPNAQNDSYTIAEDQVSEFAVLENDTDPQNNIVNDSLRITAPPMHGTATVNKSAGTIIYTPEKDYSGTDNFTYKVTDATNYSDQAQVTIEITPVNDPPVAVNDTVTFKEDQKGENIIDILGNDFDIDNQIDSSSVTIFRAPVHGQVSFDDKTYMISYIPEADFFGNDSLIYEISDVSGATSQGSVFITVLPVEDPPQPQDDHITTDEETEVIYNILTNDIDIENNIDYCSITILTQPTNGMLKVLGDPDCGKISYTPAKDYLGEDVFVYQISDITGLKGQATVYITINNTPDPPEANDDNYSVSEDSTLIMNVLLNDVDPDNNIDSSRISIVDYPQNGSVEIRNNRVVYVPSSNYYGSDVFSYQVCDSTSLCDTADVFINITPVNDPPVAFDDNARTTNQPVKINVAENDIDVDGNLDLYSIVVITSPQHGSVTVENGTGFITYTPADEDYYGIDSFVYRICDTHGACDTATVYLEITSGNIAPITEPDYVTTDEDTPVSILPASNDTDPNNNLDITSITIVEEPEFGTATLDALLSQIVYEPKANYYGNDTIVYSICDNGVPSLCSTGYIYISISPVNDSPVAGEVHVEIFDNSTIDIDVLSYCTDPENDLLTVSISEHTPPIDGEVSVNEDGTIKYTSVKGVYCKTEKIIYKTCDMFGLCDTATVFVSLLPTDSDGDNIPDFIEKDGDSDNDGTPNYLDDDSDGDGISDYIEGDITDPCNDILPDSDGDFIPDYLDDDSDNDGYSDKDEGTADCDNDGIPNYKDPEDDCVERLDVPDTFSPNGDGINDYFRIPGANDLPNDHLYIYNRWGGLVYESNNYDNTWDGRSTSKMLGSDELEEGTYFYIYLPDDTMEPIKGTVYLKR
jgi:gliding motility-associated-like protein